MLMYHGSPYGGIKSFDEAKFLPVFFTPEERVAKEYAFSKDLLAAQKDPGVRERKPTIYRVEVTGVSPFDMRKPDHLALYQKWRTELIRDSDDEEVRYDYPSIKSEGFLNRRSGLPQYGNVRPLWRMLEEKAPGEFDSLWVDEGSQGVSLALFEPAGKTKIVKINPSTNPSEEVLDGADLYHVTYYCNLKSIARRGLVAGHGKAIGRGNFSHSRGRVFLTEADGILFWMERYEAFAEHDSEDVLEDGLVPVVLMFTDSVVTELVEKGRLEDDALGTRDANAPAYYVEDLTITPDEILVWNGQEWTTIDDWESIDPESSFQWVKDEDFEEGGFFQFKDLTDIQLLPPEGQK